jgi:O-antigen ligase/Flp pilus assembly protein TadD
MQSNETHRLPADWFDLLCLSGIAFTGLCPIRDPLFLFGIVSALFLFWKGRKNTFRLSWIDRILLFVYLYQIVHLFFSIEPVSGFFSIKTLTFSLVFYFLLRVCLTGEPKIKRFLSTLNVLIAVLCAVALITFLLFRSACRYAELSCLYDFRYLYKPLGYLSNVWGTLLIGFTGVILLSLHLNGSKKTTFFLLLFLLAMLLWNGIISFSRGVYIALVVLLLLYSLFLLFSGIVRERKIWILAALILPIGIAGWTHQEDVVKTVQFNRSLSQQRSIAGRVEAMSFSSALLKESPLTGYGAGVYSQVINEYKYEDDDNSFTNFAPNGYTQLLVEQGIIGFVLWGIFFISIFILIIKRRKDSPVAIITGIILLAVLIREATFPVFLESGGFQLLIFIALAVFQNTLPHQEESKNPPCSRYFPATVFGVALLIGAYSVYFLTEDRNNRRVLSAIENGDWEKAETFIDKTAERTPYLINRSLIFRELYKKTKDISYLNRAEDCLRRAARKNPHDAMIPYYTASVLREKGNPAAALSILTDLTQKFPNKSLYRLSLFDMLHENGQKEQAFPHLLRAVKLSPDLLDASYLNMLLSKEVALNDSLKGHLLRDISFENAGDDPVALAKSGKILLSFGKEKEAKEYLEKAIRLLPNLIYPHYYLSKINQNQNNPMQSVIYMKQFVFLYSRSLSKEWMDEMIDSGEIEKLISDRKNFIDHSYPVKFQTWYHTTSITN